MTEPFDPLAELDQLLRALVDRAKLIGAYHKELVSQGFTRDEALAIVRDWQANVLDADAGESE